MQSKRSTTSCRNDGTVAAITRSTLQNKRAASDRHNTLSGREYLRARKRKTKSEMMGRTTTSSMALLLQSALLLVLGCQGWQPTITTKPAAAARRSTTTRLHVLSSQEQEVSYVVSRGDGSTGGGGLPMPTANRDPEQASSSEGEEDGLVRPKVGAEMPNGRPSWFKVPAPSQGKFCCDLSSTVGCLYRTCFVVSRDRSRSLHSHFVNSFMSSASDSRYQEVKDSLKNLNLNTVCK